MIRGKLWFCATLFAIAVAAAPLPGKDKPAKQLSWGLVTQGPVKVYAKPSSNKKELTKLESGALAAVFGTRRSGGTEWTKVRVMGPAKLEDVNGWVESRHLQSLPTDQFPTDEEIEKILGGKYLEDFYTRYLKFARFLIHPGPGVQGLLCYFGSSFLPQTRLQYFSKANGKWVAGPFIEYHFSQLQSGVAEIKIQDLVGDGNDCLITREPFSEALGKKGMNMIIRRIEGKEFRIVWEAPIHLQNFSAYRPKQQILDPPEKNIGAPGTITTATVDFQKSGATTVLLWKGKIAFYVVGREKPTDTITVEKSCAWNGKVFAPLSEEKAVN